MVSRFSLGMSTATNSTSLFISKRPVNPSWQGGTGSRILLREVLPVTADDETIRRHLQATAERMEEELGEERQLHLFEGERDEQQEQPPPDGPITVGIDGGYVRAAHKEG